MMTAQSKITDVLQAWESAGIIGPAWSVAYDPSEGCCIASFTVFATWGPHPRLYTLTEAEMCAYVGALVDFDPDQAGEAAVQLVRGGW